MEIELNNKFNIGDLVHKYQVKSVPREKILCPVCKGNYSAPNPNYEEDDEEFLFCTCCEKGYLSVGKVFEKHLHKDVYEVIGIKADITSEGVQLMYSIESRPDLNDGCYGYCRCSNVPEYMIELVEEM